MRGCILVVLNRLAREIAGLAGANARATPQELLNILPFGRV
jgi:hypothetical protein